LLQRHHVLGARFDASKLLGRRLSQARQIGNADAVLTGQRPQRKQPLFGFFESARIELKRLRRLG
jgi:hypothetical protein